MVPRLCYRTAMCCAVLAPMVPLQRTSSNLTERISTKSKGRRPHPPNYPLVRITNRATGRVFYSRTHDHSSVAVAHDGVVSTHFDVPRDQELGISSLVVVAKGDSLHPSENRCPVTDEGGQRLRTGSTAGTRQPVRCRARPRVSSAVNPSCIWRVTPCRVRPFETDTRRILVG